MKPSSKRGDSYSPAARAAFEELAQVLPSIKRLGSYRDPQAFLSPSEQIRATMRSVLAPPPGYKRTRTPVGTRIEALRQELGLPARKPEEFADFTPATFAEAEAIAGLRSDCVESKEARRAAIIHGGYGGRNGAMIYAKVSRCP